MSKQLKLLLAIVVLLTLAVVGCQQRGGEIRPQGYTNFDSIQIDVPTIQLTATPGLLIENDSAGAVSFEVRNASSTPVFSVSNTGASLVLGNQIITGATAATTATPVMLLNNAADVNDLFIVEKDATPVFTINNSGTYTHLGAGTHTGGETFNNWAIVTGATAQTTGTPVFAIENAADVNDLFVVHKDATPVFTINNSGTYTSLGAGTHTGGETFNSWAIVTGATAQTTATPVMRIGNAADVNDLFVIEKDTTPVVIVGNAGAIAVLGAISDSDSAVTFTDNVAITGQAAGTEHLVITGAASQTAASLVIEANGGTDVFIFTEAPAAASTGALFEITDTLAIMDGSDEVIGIDLNITSADHETSANVLTGLDIGNIVGDAQTADTAIKIGTGWDTDVDGVTNLILGVDNTAVVTVLDPQTAGTGGALVNVTGTFGIMDGSDTSIGIDVDLTGANHTSSVNLLNGIDLALTTADADAIESAVYIRDNWDADINATTDMVLGVDNTTVVTIMDPQAAGSGGDLLDVTGTFNIMNGSDSSVGIDVNLTGANHTSTVNAVRGIELGLTTEDADAVESAVYIEDNWDIDVNATTNLVLGVDNVTVATIMDPQTAGTGGYLLDVTGTFGAMDGTDTSVGIDVNLTGANASSTDNFLIGMDIDLTTADPQVTEVAIDVTDTDFDYAIDAGSMPIISMAQTIFDDFYGDALPDEPILLSGNDAEAVDPAIVANEQYGVMTLVSGDVGDTCANDCSEINYGTVYNADQGGLMFETRLHIDSAVTNVSLCVGFTDVATIEAPAKATGGGDGITAVADNAVAMCFDDAANTKEWFSFGIDGTTQATTNGMLGIGPTHSVYQVLRIEVDAGGEDARFYVNGTLYGSLTANVVLITADLAPFISLDSNTTASVTIDVDYIYVTAKR